MPCSHDGPYLASCPCAIIVMSLAIGTTVVTSTPLLATASWSHLCCNTCRCRCRHYVRHPGAPVPVTVLRDCTRQVCWCSPQGSGLLVPYTWEMHGIWYGPMRQAMIVWDPTPLPCPCTQSSTGWTAQDGMLKTKLRKVAWRLQFPFLPGHLPVADCQCGYWCLQHSHVQPWRLQGILATLYLLLLGGKGTACCVHMSLSGQCSIAMGAQAVIGAWHIVCVPGLHRCTKDRFTACKVLKCIQGQAHQAWLNLGHVMLAVTGAEALYADMGHFSRGAIQASEHIIQLGHGTCCPSRHPTSEDKNSIQTPTWHNRHMDLCIAQAMLPCSCILASRRGQPLIAHDKPLAVLHAAAEL